MRQQQQELQAIAGVPETLETPAAERTSIVGGAARVEILATPGTSLAERITATLGRERTGKSGDADNSRTPEWWKQQYNGC